MLFCVREGVNKMKARVKRMAVVAYVDAPEFFDRVKGYDFFQKVVPVVTLVQV